jgi:hypothetical protein
MFQTKVVEAIKTHFMFNSFLTRAIYEICGKIMYSWAGQASDENIAHVCGMLDKKGNKHTLRVYNS